MKTIGRVLETLLVLIAGILAFFIGLFNYVTCFVLTVVIEVFKVWE